MERTKQIEKERNYKKSKIKTIRIKIQLNSFLKKYKENFKKSNIDLIEELTKQFNDMKINYIQLIKENKKKIQCYNCKKFKHYTNKYKEEKQVEKCKICNEIGHNFKKCYRNQTCKKYRKKGYTKIVYKSIIERLNNIEEYYSSNDDKEIFVITRLGKTYKSKTKTEKKPIKKKSESNI